MNGRVALVTGGGRGIGREAALLLAAAGARVMAVARSESDLGGFREIIARIEGNGAYSKAKHNCAEVSPLVDIVMYNCFDASPRVDIHKNNSF